LGWPFFASCFGHAKKEEDYRFFSGDFTMIITHQINEIRQQLQALRSHKSIAFVPTMGCLHQGHLSLIAKAKTLADIVVVSIYVNPLQFGPNEDLDQYPRPFEMDAKLCTDAGVDFLFHPSSLYSESSPNVTLKVATLSDCLCGASRPGHFDGVVTVVNILLNIIQPDIAVFGEKDWQQLTILRHMVSDLHMPIDIIAAETVRETDGLALSSRNRYLSISERQQAIALSHALQTMQQLAEAGEQDVATLKAQARNILHHAGITPEYLDVRHAFSLQSIDTLNKQPCHAFIAAPIGRARLIDNIPLTTVLESTP